MVITDVRRAAVSDLARFGWAGLRGFLNVNRTTRTIKALQNPPLGQDKNVKKQAEQIRYCLVQAEEYFRAAQVVGLATKPLLMYYSIMSLALAEILLKQSGASSLDKARGEHGHHGLELGGAENVPRDGPLEDAAAALRASPVQRGAGRRFGTFELWHRTARELPLGGATQITEGQATQSSFRCLMGVEDQVLPDLATSGVTLLDCLKSLPTMTSFLVEQSIAPDLVRGTLRSASNMANDRIELNILIHPAPSATMEAFSEKVLVHPNAYEQVNIDELRSGYSIRYWEADQTPPGSLQFPAGFQIKEDSIWFCTKNTSLNEFGLFYVALYILGNYARYYPDKWMRDVDDSSPLALAVDELLSCAGQRIPILAYSELSRAVWV